MQCNTMKKKICTKALEKQNELKEKIKNENKICTFVNK